MGTHWIAYIEHLKIAKIAKKSLLKTEKSRFLQSVFSIGKVSNQFPTLNSCLLYQFQLVNTIEPIGTHWITDLGHQKNGKMAKIPCSRLRKVTFLILGHRELRRSGPYFEFL